MVDNSILVLGETGQGGMPPLCENAPLHVDPEITASLQLWSAILQSQSIIGITVPTYRTGCTPLTLCFPQASSFSDGPYIQKAEKQF